MSHEPPIIYLDTNVIRDDTQNRRESSAHLIAKIRDDKLECYTSIFAWMEMLDSEQEEKFVREKRKEGMNITPYADNATKSTFQKRLWMK